MILLPQSTYLIFSNTLEFLSSNPYKGKPLSYDLAGLHTLRTSDYRIIYRIKEKQLIIIVVTVGHRREIYKKLKELIGYD